MAFLHRFYAGGILANAVDGKDVRGYQLLSAGGNDRSFRVFSVIRSVLHKEYGQGEGLERKSHKLGIEKEEFLLPAVLEIAVLETVRRGGRWDHSQEPFVRVHLVFEKWFSIGTSFKATRLEHQLHENSASH